MKRPCIALSLLLSALAGGLAIAGPRTSQAASLGQLAFAIAVESNDHANTPVCCPLACCPFADNSMCPEECDSATDALDYLDALAVDEDEVELNPAETVDSDDSQLAADVDGDDYGDEYDDYYYGYEDYSDEYAQEYGPTWSDEADEVAADEMELNAPVVAADEGPNWDEYYAEYADDYCEEDCCEDEDCYNSDDYDPYACMPCEEAASEESSPEATVDDESDYSIYDDLILHEEVEEDAAADASADVDDEQVFCPYDCFGHQFGDDYTYEDDDYNYEDDDYSYNEEDYGDEYSQSYDDYDYEYDYDYESDYQYEEQVEVTPSEDESQAEIDYESYYEDYYSDAYDSTSGDDYDYERYYSQEYYDSLEADGTEEATDNADAAEAMDDFSSDYDQVYDEAVYGQEAACHGCDPAPADWTPAPAEEEIVVDDLPWADEIDGEGETAATASAAADCGYGCSYAEAYRLPLDEQAVPHKAAASASIESIDLPQAAFDTTSIKSLPQVFNVSRLASVCGRSMAAWSKSLSELVPAMQVARKQSDEAPRR